MQDIVNMVYVEDNLILTCVNMFVFTFAIELVFGFANLIKGIGRSSKS